MNITIELTASEKKQIKTAVLDMDSATFQSRLSHLNFLFADLFHKATLVAQEIQVMKESCKHMSHIINSPYAKFCLDCGEYFAVKTDFSPEVEKWFKEQNRLAIEQNPMIIFSSPDDR